MVIISAAICNRSGKILLSRQFAAMSRLTLEEYIKNFPKSISATAQHTFVETESIRYVYLPLESLYLVLITTKNSNIVEDLETIRLLQKVVNDLCPHGLDEEGIGKKCIDILLSFDDVIALGFRESVTLAQIQNSLSMESSEEKLHQMLQKVRMNEAREAAKKHQLEVEARRKAGLSAASPHSSLEGTGGSRHDDVSPKKQTKTTDSGIIAPKEEFATSAPVRETVKSSNPTNLAPKKGLALGKKKPTAAEEQKTAVESSKPQQAAGKAVTAGEDLKEGLLNEGKEAPKAFNPLKEPVTIEIIEKMNCQLTRDGVINSFEVIGEVMLTFHDPAKANAQVLIDHENLKTFNVKPHPSLNRQLWNSSNVLAPKEAGESFPCSSSFSTIKWRYASTEPNDLPFTVTCWQNKQKLTLEVEYNANQKRIPRVANLECHIGSSPADKATVTSIDQSEYQASAGKIIWKIPLLDATSSNANIELAFGSTANLAELPIDMQFEMKDANFYKISVKETVNMADKTPLKAEIIRTLHTENFKIV
jgi:hypothetical protein